ASTARVADSAMAARRAETRFMRGSGAGWLHGWWAGWLHGWWAGWLHGWWAGWQQGWWAAGWQQGVTGTIGCNAKSVTGVAPSELSIPRELRPVDGRFGCGPSKVRAEQIDAVVKASRSVLGTSHRQAPVRNLVGDVRTGLIELFQLPEGWEIV